ncbi:MAG: tagatose-bisphosphate aldolase [Acidobacteria bacterium]|nr:MAG: tagatose-bisphosphate aldolase [Acidobacteriota bacterium]
MTTMSTVERRAFARLTTPAGRMLVVAADQRNGMRAVMNCPDGPDGVSLEELAAAKADLVAHLGNHAPAILLDPEVALPGVVDAGTLAPHTGLVVGLDASGFETVDGLRYTRYVPGVTAATVRDLGGDAAKMLWYLRPDQPASVARVGAEIDELVRACAKEQVLLVVEILTYRLADETEEEYAARFPGLVADSARIAVEHGAKVLKLAYPGSAQACAAVTAAAAGVPWAVLSAGVDHETFVGQVREAVEHGASGAMAGRSLWKDSLAMSSQEREQLLGSRARPRLAELAATIDGAARLEEVPA